MPFAPRTDKYKNTYTSNIFSTKPNMFFEPNNHELN